MGGGGAVRAAAKVTGIGVMSGAIRGMPTMPPAEQSVPNASRPISAILSSSSSEAVKTGSIDASVAHIPAAWDDWEFADGKEELLMGSREPKPRVVFGGVPSFQEAKEATTELKDALEKVYLSSPKSTGSGDLFAADHVSGLPLLSKPELETKSCVIFEENPTPVTKPVLQAFKLLSGSSEAQSVVAAIACDPNVWNAMLDNPVLKDFMQSQQGNNEFREMQSPEKFDELSETSQTGSSENVSLDIMDMMQNIKVTVVEMVSNVSNYLHNIFGFSAAESTSSDANGNTGGTFMDRTLGVSFMGLAVLVIMVVVLKRG